MKYRVIYENLKEPSCWILSYEQTLEFAKCMTPIEKKPIAIAKIKLYNSEKNSAAATTEVLNNSISI